jgi:hypothetical protein
VICGSCRAAQKAMVGNQSLPTPASFGIDNQLQYGVRVMTITHLMPIIPAAVLLIVTLMALLAHR